MQPPLLEHFCPRVVVTLRLTVSPSFCPSAKDRQAMPGHIRKSALRRKSAGIHPAHVLRQGGDRRDPKMNGGNRRGKVGSVGLPLVIHPERRSSLVGA